MSNQSVNSRVDLPSASVMVKSKLFGRTSSGARVSNSSTLTSATSKFSTGAPRLSTAFTLGDRGT